MPTVVGIDPGKEGGVCVMRSGQVVRAEPLPLAGKLVDVPVLADMVGICHGMVLTPALVALEFQQAMPQDGAQSLNYLLPQYGQILGACMAWGWPVRTPKPREWKGVILKGTARDKRAAIDYVRMLHPNVDLQPGRKRKAHDGIADAVCIAEWGLTKL